MVNGIFLWLWVVKFGMVGFGGSLGMFILCFCKFIFIGYRFKGVGEFFVGFSIF